MVFKNQLDLFSIEESKFANSKPPLNTFRKDCLGLQDELQSNLTVMNAPLLPP